VDTPQRRSDLQYERRLPAGYFLGASTLNAARDTLYLFFFDQPIDALPLRGVRNKIKRVSVLGGPELRVEVVGGAPWLNMPGIAWIDVPSEAVDHNATVLKVELNGPLNLATKPKPAARNEPPRRATRQTKGEARGMHSRGAQASPCLTRSNSQTPLHPFLRRLRFL